MKRSYPISKIHKILQKWEGSKLDKNCANEILTMLEELGIISPSEIELTPEHFWIPSSAEFIYGPVYANEWEPERAKK